MTNKWSQRGRPTSPSVPTSPPVPPRAHSAENQQTVQWALTRVVQAVETLSVVVRAVMAESDREAVEADRAWIEELRAALRDDKAFILGNSPDGGPTGDR